MQYGFIDTASISLIQFSDRDTPGVVGFKGEGNGQIGMIEIFKEELADIQQRGSLST